MSEKVIKIEAKVKVKPRIRADSKTKAKSMICGGLILLIGLSGLFKPANLDHTDSGESKPYLRSLGRFFFFDAVLLTFDKVFF